MGPHQAWKVLARQTCDKVRLEAPSVVPWWQDRWGEGRTETGSPDATAACGASHSTMCRGETVNPRRRQTNISWLEQPAAALVRSVSAKYRSR